MEIRNMNIKSRIAIALVATTTLTACTMAMTQSKVTDTQFRNSMNRLVGTWEGEVERGLNVPSQKCHVRISQAIDTYVIEAVFTNRDGSRADQFTKSLRVQSGIVLVNGQATTESAMAAFAHGASTALNFKPFVVG
jgi:hypothetical protein